MAGLPHAVQAKDEVAREPSPIPVSSLVWLRKARIFGGAELVRQMPQVFRAVLSALPTLDRGQGTWKTLKLSVSASRLVLTRRLGSRELCAEQRR